MAPLQGCRHCHMDMAWGGGIWLPQVAGNLLSAGERRKQLKHSYIFSSCVAPAVHRHILHAPAWLCACKCVQAQKYIPACPHTHACTYTFVHTYMLSPLPVGASCHTLPARAVCN